ncbi:cytochrome c lysine N-methyltransferase KNAG_0B04270 [Huiozyma naganishii CBS 8797]|uniref:SET domain-containing protein n=1 Tax=Huiozyma naganishii (strain ATCC MYA-139 / BCRC 22969 / CBS 8797 / KCTC 17520 / NBRC 10181 / NCYC 3082 / Yp74L-3) TaxID=1071383 RepID=J7RVC2_HUIN7|nr:hypothetical protein KNAG_0B04270 [Kazachstania naganishii CBS 8797]CCK68862.1 hypothetical protein KNAG_0B04270 [Kazachstania naganishii CBS 8797]
MVVNWWRETSASLADRVTVRRSSGAAGLGLFAEGDGCSRGPDKVILRIPRGSTFDIHSVDAMIGTEAEYVHGGGVSLALFQRFSKDCWSSFSAAEHLQGLLTETVILTFHFVTLCVGERDGLEIPLRLSRYLNEVLLATTVDNPVVHPLCFAKRYRFHSRFQVYDSLVCQLCRLFSRPAGPLEPSVRQIAAAVMSRCLEIPEQDEHGDYTLNTTLVPLLDYANHSAEPNARFDADAADVVLKLDPMVAEPTEVLISYNDTVEVLDFVLTYGFVPQAATHFNFTIDRDWLLLNHRDMYRFCKWFHINLSFQAVRNTEGWCLSPANLVALNLWFTLGSKLVYEEVGLSTIDDTTSDFVHY